MALMAGLDKACSIKVALEGSDGVRLELFGNDQLDNPEVVFND